MEKCLKQPIRYNCSLCKKGFTRSNNLKSHTKYVHEKSTKFACQFCDKIYAQSQNLRNHFKTVHEGVNFGCKSCNKTC